jgi:hypothetical protein
VRKEFSPFRLALYALCLLSLFGLRAYGQDRSRDKDQNNEHPNGLVQDWSHRHVVYPRFGPIQSLIAVQHDPRAIQSWQAASRRDWRRYNRFRFPHRTDTSLHTDWSIPLGLGTTAPAMYPAKFGFDPTATVSLLNGNCTSDFIVFPVNTTGVATVPAVGSVTNGSTTVPIVTGTITPAAVGRVITGIDIPTGDMIASITPPLVLPPALH